MHLSTNRSGASQEGSKHQQSAGYGLGRDPQAAEQQVCQSGKPVFGFAQELIECLRQQGVDTAHTLLVGTIALLPAGERDHYSGSRVKVFAPVAVTMGLQDASPDGLRTVIATYDGDTVKRAEPASSLLDVKPFNKHVCLQGKLAKHQHLVAPMGDLMRGLVAYHRTITGTVSSAYEHIETDPVEIDNIRRKRFDLLINLERLARYMALDDEWLDGLCAGESGEPGQRTAAEIGFDMFTLNQSYVDEPCTSELYHALRKESFEGGYSTGMCFADYYLWFRRSEKNMDQSGQIDETFAADIRKVIQVWKPTMAVEQIQSGIARNFQVHPRHRGALERYIDTVLAEAQ